METEQRTREIPYQTCRMTYEQRTQEIPYQVCRMEYEQRVQTGALHGERAGSTTSRRST